MSSFRGNITRRAALLGALALGACGFQPIYSGKNAQRLDALRGKVKLPEAKNLDFYLLRAELVSYFGEPVAPVYDLQVKYSASSAALDIPQSGVGSRGRIVAKGQYKVVNLADGEVLLTRNFRQQSAYGYKAGGFERELIIDSARESAAKSVADEIATQVIIALSQTDA